MRRLTILALASAATAAICLGAGLAKADTCYESATVNIDCSPKTGGAKQPTRNSTSNLREVLRQRLSQPANASQAKAANAAEQRWIDAQQRAQDATDRAMQTTDPQLRAQLKQQYDQAMSDLRRAGNDLIKADPQEKATIQGLLRDYQAKGAEAAAAAGLTQPAAAPPTAAAPAPPDNVAAINGKVYVCNGTIAGANNISCREVSADGKQCTAVTLADGVVGWQDSVSTKCSQDDLAERKAFLAQDPAAAAAAAAAQPGFTMDADGTQREIDRLTADPLAAALDSLPRQCRADFEKFLQSGSAKSRANAAQAAASYAQIDKRPECRDAVKRIADALGVGLPRRKIAADQRNDWSAALAGPQRASIEEVPDIDISGIPATGFDANDSLDSAIDMLNALSGALGAARSMRSLPSYRPTQVYRAPAAPPRTYSGSSSGSQSTITGTTGN